MNVFTSWNTSGCTCEKTRNFFLHSFLEWIQRRLSLLLRSRRHVTVAISAVKYTCPCWRQWGIWLVLSTVQFRSRLCDRCFSVCCSVSALVKSCKATTNQISLPRYEPFTYRKHILSLTATPALSATTLFKKTLVSEMVDICLHSVHRTRLGVWTHAATLRCVYLLLNENLFKIQR